MEGMFVKRAGWSGAHDRRRGRRFVLPLEGSGGDERVGIDASSIWYSRVGYRRTDCSAGADRRS